MEEMQSSLRGFVGLSGETPAQLLLLSFFPLVVSDVFVLTRESPLSEGVAAGSVAGHDTP